MKGHVKDDTLSKSVKNAVAMVVRLSDSLLVKFARSDSNGFFQIEKLPIDTYLVVFSHPNFGDRTFIIMCNKNDSVLDIKNVSLPIKSLMLKEVAIYGFASPVYFKGDTLIYAADSFKVKPNAVVEDLLKKLPGIRVDNKGKIFAQGHVVDKVLVDGDEFFGKDPTIATKNLPANSVESVQVYDKKAENAADESVETEKVMNLKLKEDAKKGFFGKVSGAGDFNKFYEGQLLLNKFKGKQKISIFSFGSNTLNSQLNWEDISDYGLYGEYNFQYSDEDDTYFSTDNNASGIPKTLKNGVYFTDQIFKKTKLSLNYTNTNTNIRTKREVFSQYLFSDTSYQTKLASDEQKTMQNNLVNLSITQKIDSLTTLTLSSHFKYDKGKGSYNESRQFINSEGASQRETIIDNSNQLTKYDVKNYLSLNHEFTKKYRELTFNYRYFINNNNSNALLNSANTYAVSESLNEIKQEKTSETGNSEHMASLTYTEPLTKKIRTEISYDYTADKWQQDKKTFDFLNGTYSQLNDTFTNSFTNSRQNNRAGLKIYYDTKKKFFAVGVRLRQVAAESFNIETQQKYSQTVNALLPYATFRYSSSSYRSLYVSYSTSSKQPDLNQLQPLKDNTNPNAVYIGNPNLLPSYNQTVNMRYSFFKAVTGNSMWTSLKFTSINNNISNSVYYDKSTAKSITQPVNVNGNYNGDIELQYSIPLFSRKLEITPDINSSYSNSSNIINGVNNSTKNMSWNAGGYATLHADSNRIEISLNGNYGNTFSQTTISSSSIKTYITANYHASISYEITKKWTVESDVKYIYKTQQAQAANVSYYIWGASVNKKFLKKENMIISIEAFDLLNQNINAEQTVTDNVITYSKSNVVGRYILLRAVYKFNSNKNADNEE
ncbi:MAG: TonB-dependent receptor [Bacteroidetes bacterium]|nr:TonB-dependent receptor [Bacteroidota bacterium]